MTVQASLYDANGPDRPVELDRGLVTSLGEGRLLWVDVAGDDADGLARGAETRRDEEKGHGRQIL